MNKLAIKLRKIRETRKLTIEDQAGRIGISPGTLARLEQGKTDLTLGTIEKVSVALGLTVWAVVRLLKSL